MRRLPRLSRGVWLDITPPAITITAPGSNTVDRPVLQLQGCANEDLCSISYDLNNAAGFVSNQDVLVLDRAFDTNQWRLRTNTFQAFDIGLTPGSNTITLHAMDWAGNQTNANFVYVLDYSGKTNPPALALYWPANGAVVSGGSFTLRGAVDDPTVTLSAQITDTSGDTNVAGGIVERNGNFWVENLPLASGSNSLTLTATDATGTNVTVTNIAVFQSSAGLSIDTNSVGPITNQPTVSVSGTVDGGYTVWVNGALATNDGYGNWTALNVPVNGAGTAVLQARAIPNSQTNGATAGGGGTSSTLQNPGNPTPSGDYLDAEFAPDTAPCIIVTQLHQSYYETNDNQVLNSGGTRYSSAWTGDWTLGSAGDLFQWTWAAIGGFQWDDQTWNADGTGTDSRGSSGTFGDYNANRMTDSRDEPSGEFVAHEGSWGGELSLGLVEFCEATGTFGSAYDYDNSASRLDWESGDTNVNDYDSGTITGHSTTRMSYLPGGKSVPVQYVVALTSLAVGAPGMNWYTGRVPDWSYIPATNYTLAGLPLTTNGTIYEDYDAITYKAVPSGSPPFDITPSFDGGAGAAAACRAFASRGRTYIPPFIVDNYYEFTIDQSTYKEVIQVTTNGTTVTLDPSHPPTFCVGQALHFQSAFMAVTPGAPALICLIVHAQWTFTPGFVNRTNVGHGAYNWVADVDAFEVKPNVWYISAGTQSVTAKVDYWFSPSYFCLIPPFSSQFIVVRPTPKLINASINGPPRNMWWPGAWGHLGVGIAPNDIGLVPTNDICYSVQVLSPFFKGNQQIVQLCILYGDVKTGDNYCDGEDPYTNAGPVRVYTTATNFFGGPSSIVQLEDGPDDKGILKIDYTGDFCDTVMFRPDGSSENIYVPLGQLYWCFAYGAIRPSREIYPNMLDPPTAIFDSTTWPKYLHVFK